MFRTKTVFVVGAGASCELNFPSGATLLDRIASALDIRFANGYHMSQGDVAIYEAFRRLVTDASGRVGSANAYQHAGWRIRDAANLALSIDNVISQFDDDPLVAEVGKLAIARLILVAESESVLSIPNDRVDDGLEALSSARSTWLGGFAQLLVQDKQRGSLEGLFDQVSVISFNYDRSLRRFLPLALASQFGLSIADAQRLAAKLPIYHPYGSLGPLPWENAGHGVDYGDVRFCNLIEVAKGLRTFTEQVEDGDELALMRDALAQAERVVFLGFGYHRQNMTLLSKDLIGNATRVFGTSLGLSDADNDFVTQQLRPFLKPRYLGVVEPQLAARKCGEFINEYFRSLTA